MVLTINTHWIDKTSGDVSHGQVLSCFWFSAWCLKYKSRAHTPRDSFPHSGIRNTKLTGNPGSTTCKMKAIGNCIFPGIHKEKPIISKRKYWLQVYLASQVRNIIETHGMVLATYVKHKIYPTITRVKRGRSSSQNLGVVLSSSISRHQTFVSLGVDYGNWRGLWKWREKWSSVQIIDPFWCWLHWCHVRFCKLSTLGESR